MTDDISHRTPPLSSPQSNEEAAGRIDRMSASIRAVANKSVEEGLIDTAKFGIAPNLFDPKLKGLEAMANAVAYEAIVRRTGRPPLLVRNDRIVVDDIARNATAPGTELSGLDAIAIGRMNRFLPSVGRIEFINHQMQWGGTGWVIESKADRRWVVTNRHVAKLVARRKWDGAGVFLRSAAGPFYKMKIDMREEVDSEADDRYECQVDRIIYLADDSEADCALLEIVTTATCQPEPIPLSGRRAQVGDLVATIGYPAYDDRNEQSAMRFYFNDLFNVKRFAPGLMTQAQAGQLLMHDCTTLGGNSGSCLLAVDADNEGVVGLHFSGSFGVGNSAVSVETLRQLQTGRLFAVSVAGEGQEAAAVDEEVRDGTHTQADLEGREGFEVNFLGEALPVPIPELGAVSADLVSPSDERAGQPFEIRYTHFGVYFSRSRRSPLFTAVNIDGEQSRRIKRVSPDKWYFDDRIEKELQLGQGYYLGDLDRGHMVRREDPNWGDLAQQANDDTFHYTNAALQHALLNRVKTQWQGLENYILESSRTEGFKASVFTGPIFSDDDPELGRDEVRIPMEFWKLVVMPKVGGGLHATAYLLSQGDMIRKFLEDRAASAGGNEAASEGFQLGEFRTFQVAIKHIASTTGLSWPYLAGADPLESHENEALSAVTYVPLDSLDDIVT
jgi:endonuclease G